MYSIILYKGNNQGNNYFNFQLSTFTRYYTENLYYIELQTKSDNIK